MQATRHCLAAVYVTYLACLKAACGTAACCQHQDGGLIHCANATAPVTGDGGNAGRPAHSKEKPLILVMQLSTKNLWDSFCQYTAAVNAQWAKSFGHRYLLTDGEYLRTTDLWRGGNVRAVLEVMRQVPREVEWIFHLDCDAVLVDFHQDALSSTIGASEMQVFLSRDESGFAGTSRLSNMGTGLWRRSNWTLQFLESWWQVLDSNSSRNEQEVLEEFLATNKYSCLEQLVLLPAGLLNSESSNPIAGPPWRQPVIHLAGMPNWVRTEVFQSLWSEVCEWEETGTKKPQDGWRLRELLLKSLADFAMTLPDIPDLQDLDWTRLSESSRVARRLALMLVRGGTHREEAERFVRLALHRTLTLEDQLKRKGSDISDTFSMPLAQSFENLVGPLLELGHHQEAEFLLMRPGPPRQSLDRAIHAENLAAAYQGLGRVAEAEALVRGALSVLEVAFPPEVRDVRPAGAKARLAQILHVQGRSKEAIGLLRRALKDYEDSLGKDHPQTLNCARNLAVLLKQSTTGKSKAAKALKEAEVLLQRAASGYANAFGTEHPETQRFQRNLANFLKWRQRVHPEL